MKIYYDTEFTSLDSNVDWDLISAGFVTETGDEWYIEIKDFNREECSNFVINTVLPLLGKGDHPPERLDADHFAHRLSRWLAEFDQDIELVSDHVCDWHLVNGYCHAELRQQSFKVQGQIWLPAERESIKVDLLETELRFWHPHRGMQHHALYDARRLKINCRAASLVT
jgi:hypothetical protein